MSSKTFFIFLFLCRLATADLGGLVSAVSNSFDKQISESNDVEIGKVLETAKQNGIQVIGGDKYVGAKYLLSHWRLQTRDYYLDRLHRFDAFLDNVTSLTHIPYLLDRPALKRLESAYASLPTSLRESTIYRESLAQLIAQNGDHRYTENFLRSLNTPNASLEAGPHEFLWMGPMDPSLWKADGWVRRKGYDSYRIKDGKLYFRGMVLQEGDVVVVDLAAIFDGINTSFSSPRSSATHNGIVVFLKVGGRTIPVIFEVHSTGLRVVPLHQYLSPDFVYYFEVHRRNDADQIAHVVSEALSPLVSRVLHTQMGYNYNANPIPPNGFLGMDPLCDGVVCSNVQIALDNAMGFPIEIPASKLSEGARKLVGRLGLADLSNRGDYITPTDIMRSPHYHKVGEFDFDLKRNYVREMLMGSPLVAHSMGDLFSNRELNLQSIENGKYGLVYRTVRGLVRRPPFWLLDPVIGMNQRTVPKGPPEALATVVTMNTALKAAGKALLKEERTCPALFSRLGSRTPLDLFEAEQDPIVREKIRQALQKSDVSLWFDP